MHVHEVMKNFLGFIWDLGTQGYNHNIYNHTLLSELYSNGRGWVRHPRL